MIEPLDNYGLEELCLALIERQQATGAILVMLHGEDRAEVIAAISGDKVELSERLHRMAEEVGAGAGIPVGRNLQTVPHP